MEERLWKETKSGTGNETRGPEDDFTVKGAVTLRPLEATPYLRIL